LRVFDYLHPNEPNDLAENAYLDRLDHYLQLFYRHQGLKISSLDVKMVKIVKNGFFEGFWRLWSFSRVVYTLDLAENSNKQKAPTTL